MEGLLRQVANAFPRCPNCFWNSRGWLVILIGMSDATQILSQIEAGDAQAARQLLLLVYGELRKLAAAKLAQERPGQTLQATALVRSTRLAQGRQL